MNLLVLGGTARLGRHVAAAAVDRGHRVTCLARGSSGAVPAGARPEIADRDEPGALETTLGERAWDVVVDVSRQPGHVRRAVEHLRERAGHYTFVSSGNVYADHSVPGQDETAATLPPLDGDLMESMETYGEAKVACEQAVLAAFGPGRALVARAGLIGGPGDASDRSGYWPLRFARPADPGGEVLVPDVPEHRAQLVDVRDLAAWLVEAGTAGASGVVNATGPTTSLREHLDVAREVAGHRGEVVPATRAWLLEHEVQPWTGPRSLPLWVADPGWLGFPARDSGRARALGLTTRPLADTLRDTLAWELSRPAGSPRRAGLSDDDERALLAERGRP